MKKKYDPIRVPVCRCGKPADVVNLRIACKIMWKQRTGKRINATGPIWLCYCNRCSREFFADTKRAAVAAFEKAVEIHVEG